MRTMDYKTIGSKQDGWEGFSQFMEEARKQPMLSFEDEQRHARAAQAGDAKSLDILARSHMRMVGSLARDTRFGMQIMDIVSEGMVGLMIGISKFEPDKGYRLSTYAQFWVRAMMHEYGLRNQSILRMRLTPDRKRVYFNLPKIRRRMDMTGNEMLTRMQIEEIAVILRVSVADVEEMSQRMAANAIISVDTVSDAVREKSAASGRFEGVVLVDGDMNPEEKLLHKDEAERRRQLLDGAMSELNERERVIVERRRLHEDPPTLAELAIEFGVTGERIRQIENVAMRKITAAILSGRGSGKDLPFAA